MAVTSIMYGIDVLSCSVCELAKLDLTQYSGTIGTNRWVRVEAIRGEMGF